MNHMEKVAKILGVELGEVFNILYRSPLYKITLADVFYYDIVDGIWDVPTSVTVTKLLTGELEIVKILLPPKIGDKYYRISTSGKVQENIFKSKNEFCILDTLMKNHFETFEQAIKNKKNILNMYDKIWQKQLDLTVNNK